MKRAKFFSWTIFSLIITLLIISIIKGNQFIFFIPLLVIFFGVIIFSTIELKIIRNKLKPFYLDYDYNGAIVYLNNQVYKCFILINAYSCIISLVISYMLLGDTDKAKSLLDKYSNLKKNGNLFYIQMLILISENRLMEAGLLQQKLLKLRNKKFKVQKEASFDIFSMIDTKTYDENLYSSTKYPLLKSICLRYKNGGMDEDERTSAVIQNKQFLQFQKNTGTIKLFSILLNVFTFLSLFIALVIISIKSESYNPITSTDSMYYSLKTIWVFWLFLPLSFGCFIFGLIHKKKDYKTTSNIVIGIIFSLLLFGFGSMHFLGLKEFNTDTDYLNNLGDTIQVDFPSKITIVTQDLTNGKQRSSDDNYYKYLSVVRFNDDTEISSFENNMNDNYWLDGFTGKTIKFLPTIFILETKYYDKYLLYCYESNEYNPEESTSKYNYICIAYSKENKSLIIYEFSIK
jgi:hypothetical protein